MKLMIFFLLSFLVTSASAGPIFNLIGISSQAPLHPDGDDSGDRMAPSGIWGVTTTGAGFMDGRITFVDGFALPMNTGDTVTFDGNDIAEFSFDHSQVTGLSGSPSIIPVFGFTALASDIVSASGDIYYDGNEYYIRNNGGPSGQPTIITTVEATIGSVFGTSGITGTWEMLGGTYLNLRGIGNDQGRNVALQGDPLFGNGRYELTGFTSSVPEPGTLVLYATGVLLLTVRRRRKL